MPTPEIDIARDPDAVWAVVGDFGGLAGWMPGVESCTVEGDVRTVGMMGIEVAERLTAKDDAARAITYSVLPGGPAPIDSHTATISVEPAGAGSKVTWAVTVEPAAMQEMFEGIYAQSLGALKAHCEG